MPKTKGQAEVEKQNRTLQTLEITYVPPNELTPNSWNPNRQSDHDFELLLRSMREDGFTQPVVALKNTKIIVDGEHRWRAGQALGMHQIPVVYVDMTEEQAKIATLRHNRARGSEDAELAANLLRDLVTIGAGEWAADSLMLDDEEMERLLIDVAAPDALAGQEFSQAWEPSPIDQDNTNVHDDPRTAQTITTQTPGGGTTSQAMSAAAIEIQRQQERALQTAKTTEEREAIAREAANFHRVILMFHGEDAQLVKRVLGDHAADKLVELCRNAEPDPETTPDAA